MAECRKVQKSSTIPVYIDHCRGFACSRVLLSVIVNIAQRAVTKINIPECAAQARIISTKDIFFNFGDENPVIIVETNKSVINMEDMYRCGIIKASTLVELCIPEDALTLNLLCASSAKVNITLLG